MDQGLNGSEARFAAYVEALDEGLGLANRVGPLKQTCTGLPLPGEYKRVEPVDA